MAVTGTPRMVTDGLVLCLDAANVKSYPGSGTTWTDLSLTQLTGSLTNGPIFSSVNNGAIVFDGTNDNITLSSTLGNGLTRLTLECWVSTTAGSGHMISKGASGNYQYALRIGTGDLFGGGATGSAMVIAWQSFGSNHNTATTNFSINDSKWHHIVGVIVENTSAKIYLDGVLRETRTNPTGSWYKTGNAAVMVGGRADGGANYLSGSISLAKIYNRDLSDAEVLQNFEATRERFGV